MELDLKGKSALITGGSKGIGFATARAFAAEGASLHIAARNTGDLERAREVIIRDFDVPVAFHAVDLTQGHAVRELAKECADVDILVNNAGAIPGGSLEDIDEDRWREMYSDLPGGSAATSEDIANAVAFLASSRARYISGTVLTIDGGLSASQAVVGS